MEYSELLQKSLEVAIQVLLPVVLGFLVVFIRAKIAEVKSKIPQEQMQFASALAKMLVLAAEQNGLIGALEDVGEEKKRWVMGMLDQALKERGIVLDLETLSAMIEAAVHEAFKKPDEVPQIHPKPE